jgi:hypothetical protein
VFGNAADTFTIRTAVCSLFLLVSWTLQISHKSASDVFHPVCDPYCPGCHHPFNVALVDRCKVIAFSTNFAIVGRREVHRLDLILVRSLHPCFGITITIASLSVGRMPVWMRSLIKLQSPFGSDNNQMFNSCHQIPMSPGTELLLGFLNSLFSILGHTFKLWRSSESTLPCVPSIDSLFWEMFLMSAGFDGNDTFALASIFSFNIRNWSPDGDVRTGGIALGYGLELIDFHTIPGSVACRYCSQHSRSAFCIARSHRFLRWLH